MLDFVIYGGLWNIFVFILYGIDKKRAIRNEWRIPEQTLLLITLLCGGLGAILAGHYFRHKTQKWYFQLSWIIGLFILVIIYYLILKY